MMEAQRIIYMELRRIQVEMERYWEDFTQDISFLAGLLRIRKCKK